MPILCSSGPVDTPAKSRSTIKPVNFSPSTLAKVMNTCANAAFVMNILVPFRM